MASINHISFSGSASNDGRFEITGESVVWKHRDGDPVKTLPLKNVTSAQWYTFGKSCALWLKEGASVELHRYEGFSPADYERVGSALASSCTAAGLPPLKLEKARLSTKGRNFGSVKVEGSVMQLLDDSGAVVVPIPLSKLSQAVAPGKGEVDFTFMDDDTLERDDEACVEMRLWMPPGHKLPDAERAVEAARARRKGGAEEGGAGEDGGEDDEDGEGAGARAGPKGRPTDPDVGLAALVSASAGLSAAGAGDAIAELGEDIGQFLVPRGRFAIEFYPTFFRLAGKTYEFKIAYKSIARMFYLPRPAPGEMREPGTETRFNFVISLDEPIRQGQQRHPHLVMQLDKIPVEVGVKVSEEDRAAGRYEGLGAESAVLAGDCPKVVAQLFKAMSSKPIFKPGLFLSAAKARALRTSLKSSDGLLFPLDKSMVFVPKPAVWIRYSDIEVAEFDRRDAGSMLVSASKSFDLVITCKGAPGEKDREYVFAAIDKSEREGLKAFFEGRGVTVHDKAAGRGRGGNYAELDGDDEEDPFGSDDDDEDFSEEDSDSDDGGRKKKKSKKDKKEKKSAGKKRRRDDSEDDDDDDSDDDDDDDDSDDGGRKKSKGKGKPPKKKARKGNDSD